jgi:DNA-nicking Smr family endonuclease
LGKHGWMKRRVPTPVSDDDTRLFRDAIGDVRPIQAPPAPPERPKPAPYPFMRDADEAAVPGQLLRLDFDPAFIEIGEEISYLRDGYPPRLLKQLKRGQFSVQAELDLHHMNAAAAQASIVDFIAECRHEGVHCVRIIHGKGLRSRAQGPVLKALTDRLLRRRDDVVGFASARPAQGGTGATIVLLKNS